MVLRFSAIFRGRFPGIIFLLAALAVLVVSGCASELRERRFTELVQRYPATTEPLKVKLLPSAPLDPETLAGKSVVIIVHPAYALFFRDERRNTYTEAKYDLLEYQLSEETLYISKIVRSGDLLILVIPGRYEKDSIAPESYTSYLNLLAGDSSTAYYIRSETSHSGAIPLDTTVKLHDFLRNVKADRILVGGGFIGRCQREFYGQLSSYVENIPSFIVPEISSLSPDDISSKEAFNILNSIRRKDFQPVVDFIESKSSSEDLRILLLTTGESR